MNTTKTFTVDPVTADDWDLVLYFCHWSYTVKLPGPIIDKAYKLAWEFTDAYGAPGLIPPQGYDWSGFRDSTELSQRNSAKAIRLVLERNNIKQFEVTEESL
jgi:hypothetical protein